MTSPDAPDQPTAPNSATAMAVVLVDEFVRLGLANVVICPGSRSTALTLAFAGHARVRAHVCLDERSAGFVALGLAKASGKPTAVVTTSGSAVVNLHPAVLEASMANVPLLVLSADRPPALRHTGANQTIDQIKVFGESVRWFVEVGEPHDDHGANAYWRTTADQAWSRASGFGGRPGPVHLNLAFAEPTVPHTDDGRTRGIAFLGPVAGRDGTRPWTRTTPTRRDGGAKAHELADRLRASERAVLVVGEGAFVPAPVTQLARAANIPMIAEPLANARRGDSGIAHAHLMTKAGLLPTPDLVVRVGRTGLSPSVQRWLAPQVEQVLIDPHGQHLDAARSLGEVIVADADALCALAAGDLREGASLDSSRLTAWKALDGRVSDMVQEAIAGAGLTGPGVATRLVAELPTDTALVIASSAPIRDVDSFAPLREDLWMLGNRGASGIDGFTSTSLGIAMAHHGPTVALAGDLSFLHDQGGWLLRPDARSRGDLVVVVVDNNGGGLFHQLPVANEEHFERFFATPHDRDLGLLARAHGCEVSTPATLDDVVPAVLAGISAGGRHVVHVRTDRVADHQLRADIASAVARLDRLDA